MGPTRNADGRMVRYQRDPLLNFLSTKLTLPWPAIVGLAMAVVGVAYFGVGAVVAYVIHREADIIGPLDPEFLYFNLVVVFVNIPLIWLLYLWQPELVAKTMRSLQAQQVFVDAENDGLAAFTKAMKANLDSYWVSALAAIVAFGLVLVGTFVVFPAESQQMPRPLFWFYDKYYYLLVFTPVRSLTFYVTAMVALRGVLTLIWFNLLFQRHKTRIHPMHPDQAGGLGALGSLGVQYGLIAVALGALLALVTIDRILHGSGWMHIDLLIGYALYVVLAPVSLISPLWSAHRAMTLYRDEVLRGISNEFERILTEKEPRDLDLGALDSSKKRLDALRARYALVRDAYPTWPISTAAFRKFSITASLPLLTGAASIVLDLAAK
jgi:hypothetical protein